MSEFSEFAYEWVLVFSGSAPEEEVKARANSLRLLKAAGLVPLTCKSKEEVHIYGKKTHFHVA
jgi:hypothetical protein